MLPERRERNQRLYFTISSPWIGIVAGALTADGVMTLMPSPLPPPSMLSRLTLAVWVHAMIGLSSFASGAAVAWFLAWGAKGVRLPTFCRHYSLAVAFAWSLLMTCIFWRGAMLFWPLFAIDLVLVALAGWLGSRFAHVGVAIAGSAE
jgi:hypothetical protein